ncbi:DUF4344 domain-containing metallopeptidase [Streptomyces sp. NBC_00377]|uniref:DUF4344 domain-containing metallopeptidase n=1 Tax=unclassified Streptomyces TaxID=2593676 RepID=UPI002E1F6074|nr:MULTISPECIES: DUF4344 domain-containing metallopeptidase [unclassified Streptomyces]
MRRSRVGAASWRGRTLPIPTRTAGAGNIGRRARGRTALRAAALTLVAAALTAACQTAAPGGPRTSEASFTVHYERPSARDKDDAAFVRAHKLPEEAVRSVTALVKLDPPVVMSVRSCAGEGSAYDPDTRRVEICYDEITETRELYRDSGERLLDDTLSAVMLETLFHESAHAVIDALDLRVGGREEDFADQFAALMLLRQGAQGESRLLAAARTWRLASIMFDPVDDGREDEHSTDRRRAVNHYCYVYGSAPATHEHLIHPQTLTARRARGCAREWQRVRAAWVNALGRTAVEGDGGGSARDRAPFTR